MSDHYKPDRITDPFTRPLTPAERLWDLLPATRAQIRELWAYVISETTTTAIALNRLEEHLSAIDDLITRFSAATDEIAAELKTLRDEVAGLDAATAAKFEPLVARLEALGADPQNPVPAPEPTPEPSPEPTPEPTPEG